MSEEYTNGHKLKYLTNLNTKLVHKLNDIESDNVQLINKSYELGQENLLLDAKIQNLKLSLETLTEELEKIENEYGLCRICLESNKPILIGCCSGKLCTKCWKNMETKSGTRKQPVCPYCRTNMPSLLDVLIRKIEEF